MKLLGEYTHKKEGNECLITNYICLVQLNSNLYLVTCTKEVYGGWTGNPITTESKTFREYTSASDYMDVLIKELKYYEED